MHVEAACIVSPKEADGSNNNKEDGRSAESSKLAYNASALQSRGLLLLLLGLLTTVQTMCTSAWHSILPCINLGTQNLSDYRLLGDMLKRQGAPAFKSHVQQCLAGWLTHLL